MFPRTLKISQFHRLVFLYFNLLYKLLAANKSSIKASVDWIRTHIIWNPKGHSVKYATTTTQRLGYFLKMGLSRPLLLYFRIFNIVDSNWSIKFLPMTGFEPRTSGIKSDHSTNWATTTSQILGYLVSKSCDKRCTV